MAVGSLVKPSCDRPVNDVLHDGWGAQIQLCLSVLHYDSSLMYVASNQFHLKFKAIATGSTAIHFEYSDAHVLYFLIYSYFELSEAQLL